MAIKPILLGQAPSRKGDGRAFTGPSGKTLTKWLGVDDRDGLSNYFDLDNLVHHPLAPNTDPHRHNSELTPSMAREGAQQFLVRTKARLLKELGQHQFNDWIDSGRPVVVVALGTKVWRGFNFSNQLPWFHWEMVPGGEFLVVKFPHPSGLNHELNDPEFAREVATRLRRIAWGHIDSPTPADPNHSLRQL